MSFKIFKYSCDGWLLPKPYIKYQWERSENEEKKNEKNRFEYFFVGMRTFMCTFFSILVVALFSLFLWKRMALCGTGISKLNKNKNFYRNSWNMDKTNEKKNIEFHRPICLFRLQQRKRYIQPSPGFKLSKHVQSRKKKKIEFPINKGIEYSIWMAKEKDSHKRRVKWSDYEKEWRRKKASCSCASVMLWINDVLSHFLLHLIKHSIVHNYDNH